jgi:hypothetical protein
MGDEQLERGDRGLGGRDDARSSTANTNRSTSARGGVAPSHTSCTPIAPAARMPSTSATRCRAFFAVTGTIAIAPPSRLATCASRLRDRSRTVGAASPP